MKAPKKWLKTVSLFLTALILFQSCSAYKTPITLEQAALEQKAIKITTASDESVKYKYIVYEDGQFYGVKNNPGEDVKFPIDTEEVANLLMKNGGIPWWAWILMVLGGLFVFLLVGSAIDGN